MALTVGSTLQNGKYVIQAIESESDRGVTYRVNHTDLDQTVVIQTVKQQAENSPVDVAFQKQFLQAAKTLAQRQPPIVRVRDYFTEANQPFVVLEPIADQPLPTLESWFSFAPLEANSSASHGASHPLNTGANNGKNNETNNGANNGTNNGTQPAIEAAIAAMPAPAVLATSQPVDRFSASEAIVPEKASQNGTKIAHLKRSQPVAKSALQKFWLPIGLVSTSLIAAGVGASYGWALRFSAPQGSSGGGLSLFDKEQSFPPIEGFPGENPVDYEAPEAPTHSIREIPVQESSRYREPYVEPYRQPERPAPSRVSAPSSNEPSDVKPAQDETNAPVVVPTEPVTPPVDAMPPADSSQPVEPQPKVETAPAPVAPPVAPAPIETVPAPISQ